MGVLYNVSAGEGGARRHRQVGRHEPAGLGEVLEALATDHARLERAATRLCEGLADCAHIGPGTGR